ncbi:MAG: sulfatase family protein [Chloroflexota bacterium]
MANVTPMNILILMGDQHRWDALGCAADGIEPWQRTWLMGGAGGRPMVQTPHLDRLAATGVRFSQAVANLPVCVPCRHSFITGLYPHQIGILTNAHYWPEQPPVPTLGTCLKGAGYATAAVGKMHWKNRNAPDEHVPDKRGFDFRASRGGNTDGPFDVSYLDFITEDERRARAGWAERFGSGGESRQGYVGDVAPFPAARLPEAWLADQAVAYLRRHRQERGGQPFCLVVSLDRPHPPNVIPADYDGRYDPDEVPIPPPVPAGFHEDDAHIRRQIVARSWGEMDEREIRHSVARYLTNVTYVDDCLGRVLAALEEGGVADQTLVVLLSDHGELLGERAGGHTKYCLYDSALRVPLIVRWPGVNQAGLVSPAAVELVDLMPTWLEAAGLPVPAMLPGRSLRPLLEGQAPEAVGWREATLSEQYTSVDTPGAPRGQWTVREQRYKLIERVSAPSALYDLQEDPQEVHNRIDDPVLAAVRERLRARLVRGVITRAEAFPAQWEPVVTIARPR